MRVLNVHQRLISKPQGEVKAALATLATEEDKIWPLEKWPAMRFKAGLVEGARGGHGPVRYWVEEYVPGQLVQFRFIRPRGLEGIHKLEIRPEGEERTMITHTIDASAFDKLENDLCGSRKKTEWNWWVKVLRSILK